jgi:hypothetical protein
MEALQQLQASSGGTWEGPGALGRKAGCGSGREASGFAMAAGATGQGMPLGEAVGMGPASDGGDKNGAVLDRSAAAEAAVLATPRNEQDRRSLLAAAQAPAVAPVDGCSGHDDRGVPSNAVAPPRLDAVALALLDSELQVR